MIEITDEDITTAEILFLPDGEKFCDEKRQVLKCLQSTDIVACPGSGKTTTLLAKISIIGNRFTGLSNQGICVLTHTNVAIDEIKERIGNDSRKLFEYPNFFGTIQSFINRFLATPYFQNQTGLRVNSIDDELYNKEVIREFYKLDYGIREGLFKKCKSDNNILQKMLENMRFSIEDDGLIDKRTGNSLYKTENKTTLALKQIKGKILKRGILSYDDAYWLAHKYLLKYGDHLTELFSKRFTFLFIDEMQDTSSLQNDILNRLFNKEEVIIQRFGDPNQSIYEEAGEENTSWVIRDKSLKITDSQRNSPVISSLINSFEIKSSDMKGNDIIRDIQPKIIIYEDNEILEILPRFARLIIENGLQIDARNIFKAVGKVGQVHQKGNITIPSYFPTYKKKVPTHRKKEFLSDFINKDVIETVECSGVYHYKKSILDAFIKILWKLKIEKEKNKYYNRRTFLQKVESKDINIYRKLEDNLYDWCLGIKKGQDIKEEFITFCELLLGGIFDFHDFEKLDPFFEGISKEVKSENEQNIFFYAIDGNDKLPIHINTIAGVKGETHTGTLFMETFNYIYDVNGLIDNFKGFKEGKIGKRKLSAKKHAYVAMSRPTHLLCVAARKSSVEGHEEELIKRGWELIYIKDNPIRS